MRAGFALLFALCIGTSAFAQSGHRPIKVVGESHTLVLFADGTVTAWGRANMGQIGPISDVKQRNNVASAPVDIKLPRKAIDIATADNCSFALLDDGTVASWGSNLNRLLGSEGVSGSENPLVISGLTGIAKIAAGGQIVLALRPDGTVYGWGRFFDRSTPAVVEGLTGIKELSIGSTHSMALDGAGNVWTFGDALYGSLGRLDNPGKPEKVPGLSGVTAIAAGLGVSTVVKKDGTVWVWGSNFQGQFGDGQRTAAPVSGGLHNQIQLKPQQVPGVRNAVSVTSGNAGRHTLALLKDSTLRGWGNTDWGQLGGGVTGTFQLSAMTPKIANVRSIFGVGNNSVAIKRDGTVWIWGIGHKGEYPLQKVTSTPTLLPLK